MKSVKIQVRDHVWDQIDAQVGSPVWLQVGNGNQVWYQVSDQVKDQVWDQVEDQT